MEDRALEWIWVFYWETFGTFPRTFYASSSVTFLTWLKLSMILTLLTWLEFASDSGSLPLLSLWLVILSMTSSEAAFAKLPKRSFFSIAWSVVYDLVPRPWIWDLIEVLDTIWEAYSFDRGWLPLRLMLPCASLRFDLLETDGIIDWLGFSCGL